MSNPNDPGQPLPVAEHAAAGITVTTDLPTPSVALAIGAHPDDVEFGCGATLAKWAADGCVIHHLVCTDGSKGTWDPDADTAALATRRRREQAEAAQKLAGPQAGEVFFLGRVDGELTSDLETRGEVAKVIRTVRPDIVLGHDPWKRYRLHPDHRHAGLLACEGVVAARDPHFYREHGLAPHRPQHLLLWEAEVVDHVEDVGGWVGRKLDALAAHESQFESTMGVADPDELEQFNQRIRARLAVLGDMHGLDAAELFTLISDL